MRGPHRSAARAADPVRLRINADDFGRSSRINHAAIRAHREGVLTSVSLMVCEPAAAEAVELARAHPGLRVGLHLCLAGGRPAAVHAPSLGLTGPEGLLRPDPVRQALRFTIVPAARRAAEREVAAQLERFAATGLKLSHVDGHLNMHLVPPVLSALCRLLPRYGRPEVRVPRERLAAALSLNPRRIPYKLAHALVFALLGPWARWRLRSAGLPVADRVMGLLSTFDPPDAGVLRGLIAQARGRTEIYLHPGAAPQESDTELAALTDPAVAHEIAARGIVLAGAGS
jgi:chitin disaccharide deacetylase